MKIRRLVRQPIITPETDSGIRVNIQGPSLIHVPGSLHLEQSHFPTTAPHIASPDVVVDPNRKRIVMYFHGLEKFTEQFSRVATSLDGIHFTALPDIIGGTTNPGMGKTYLRSSR